MDFYRFVLPFMLSAFLTFSFSCDSCRGQASAQELPEQELPEYAVEGWVFGDVVELDSENSRFILVYFDYHGREKEMEVKVDAGTKYENVSGFDDIKAGDALSVDYLITPEGEAVALSISVEGLKGAKE